MAKNDPAQTQNGQDAAGASAPAAAPEAAAPAAAASSEPAKTKAAAPAAAAPAFLPKRGQFVNLTETVAQGPNKGKVTTNLFLISGVGSTSGPKRNENGAVVTEKATVKYGDTMKEITRAVMETVPVFEGIIISAQMQFTTPKRGVLLENLTPLEA